MSQPSLTAKSSASWERIINHAKVITSSDIALCCRGCNASKGEKTVSVWLVTKYCQALGIAAQTVAPIIKNAIRLGQ